MKIPTIIDASTTGLNYNPADWDLRLTAASQARDKGSNALAVDADGNPLVRDLDGNHRIVNGAVDIGAYEYGSTPAPAPAPAPSGTAFSSIAWTSPSPLAIVGHEELPGGRIRLFWNVEPGMLYSIWSGDQNISGDLTVGEWIDENPLASNDYRLAVVYEDSTTAFSDWYTVKRSAQPFEALAGSFEAFWREYDLNAVEEELFLLV